MSKHNTKVHFYTRGIEDQKLMRIRKQQNLINCQRSKAEEWFKKILSDLNLKIKPKLKWTRQAQWGMRLFDFWNSKYGIAVEVDGPEHLLKSGFDKTRDTYNFERSGIFVFRVRNFNEDDAKQVVDKIIGVIKEDDRWLLRRQRMGLLTKLQKINLPKYTLIPSIYYDN